MTRREATAVVTKRLQKELMTLMMEPVPGATAFPESDNLYEWVGTITGTAGTVYDGLAYKLSVTQEARPGKHAQNTPLSREGTFLSFFKNSERAEELYGENPNTLSILPLVVD